MRLRLPSPSVAVILSRVRRIFERDAEGRIIGFNTRYERHDLHFKRVA